jgi:hypothetical protein
MIRGSNCGSVEEERSGGIFVKDMFFGTQVALDSIVEKVFTTLNISPIKITENSNLNNSSIFGIRLERP